MFDMHRFSATKPSMRQGAPMDALRHEPAPAVAPAGATAEALANGLEMVVDNVLDFLSGSVRHRAD